MDSNINNTITHSEFVCMAVGAVINFEVLSLPRSIASISLQDAWISTAIGGIYPLYLCIMCCIISKKHPSEDILSLSNKYFGKKFGNILNLTFSFQFIILTVFSSSGYASINRVYSVPFLSNYKIILITLGVSAYFSLKKIKSIGKISSYVFFLTILLILLPLFNLNKGNIINLLPFMGSGCKKIFLGSIQTIYPYAGIEVIFLFYPFISDKNKTKSSILVSPLLLILIYTFVVFITLYILNPDITPKSFWPLIAVTEGLNLPIMSSFRFVFIYLWSFIAFNSFVIAFYSIFHVYKYTFKRNISTLVALAIFLSLSFLSILLSNQTYNNYILSYIAPIQAMFSIVYTTAITFFVLVKG